MLQVDDEGNYTDSTSVDRYTVSSPAGASRPARGTLLGWMRAGHLIGSGVADEEAPDPQGE